MSKNKDAPKDSFSKALNYAYRLLAIRGRSQKEIEIRLRDKGYGDDPTGKVIEILLDKGFLNDQRFIRECIKVSTASRPKGILAIKDELRRKGLKEALVNDALEDASVGYDELEVARNLARKKSKSLGKPDKIKDKKGLYSYLARRGFSFDVINDVIGEE